VPKNTGRKPSSELVDIRFRNGVIKRNVDPDKWRWKSWGWESDWDIVQYQIVEVPK